MAKITFVCSFFKASRIQLFTFNDQKSRESRLGDYLHKMCCLAYWHNEAKIVVKSYYMCKYRYLNLRITKSMKTKIRSIWAFSHLKRSISCKKNCRQKGLEFGIDKFALLRQKKACIHVYTTSRGFLSSPFACGQAELLRTEICVVTVL